MSLNTDYRPGDLGSLIGNADVLKMVRAKFEGKKLKDVPHCVLIVGPAGTGKTTLGRIIARMVGGLLKGEDPDTGATPNYREVNSATDGKLDNVREMKRVMKYKPVGEGKARVWMWDECHKISTDGKEGLLKPMEKPLPHVIFIMATSEPGSLKESFTRRCLRIEMAPVDEEDMTSLLKTVAKKKKVKKVPSSVYEKIYQNSLGSPGMALQLLEAVIDFNPKEMKNQIENEARKASQVIDLCRALTKKEPWKKIGPILKGLRNESPETVRRGVLGFCTTILLSGDNPIAYSIMDAFREPFYTAPFEQLVLASYECLYAEED